MVVPTSGPVGMSNVAGEFGMSSGPVRLSGMRNWGGTQHASNAWIKLSEFRGTSGALWPYPPKDMPLSTSWTKTATLYNGVRTMTANVTGLPYANGTYGAYSNATWSGYVNATGAPGTGEATPAGPLGRRVTAGYGGWISVPGLSSTVDGGPIIVGFDLPYAVTPLAYKIMGHATNTNAHPSKWTLDASNDKTTWTTVDSRSNVTWTLASELYHYALSPTRAFQYWRLAISRIVSASPAPSVSKFVLVCPEQPAANVPAPKYLAFNDPVVSATGGYNDGPYVGFDSSAQQFCASTAPLVTNIRTNGGFTAMSVACFFGAVTSNERLFEFGNNNTASGTANFATVTRATLGTVRFSLYNGSANWFVDSTSSNVIVQGAWNLWVARYYGANGAMQLYQDGNLVGSRAIAANLIPDRTTTANCLGRGLANPIWSNVRVKNLVMWDRFLSDAEVTTAAAFLQNDAGSLPAGTITYFAPSEL